MKSYAIVKHTGINMKTVIANKRLQNMFTNRINERERIRYPSPPDKRFKKDVMTIRMRSCKIIRILFYGIFYLKRRYPVLWWLFRFNAE